MSEEKFDDVLSEIAEKCMPKHTCIISYGQYRLLEKSKNDDGSFSVKIKSPAYSNGKLVGHLIASLNSVVFNERGDMTIYENMPVDEHIKNKGYVSFIPVGESQIIL